jgi:hypothetical protein
MIDPRKSDVFEGEMPQSSQGVVGAALSFRNLNQQSLDAVGIHEISVASGPVPVH